MTLQTECSRLFLQMPALFTIAMPFPSSTPAFQNVLFNHFTLTVPLKQLHPHLEMAALLSIARTTVLKRFQ